MYLSGFPRACNTKLIYDFGGHYGGQDRNTVEEIIEWVTRQMGTTSAYYVASTCKGQKNAARALRKLGFKSSIWNRCGWSGRKARIWWYCNRPKTRGLDT